MARKPKNPIRETRLSAGELVQVADKYADLTERDMADLASYGISAATVTDLLSQREALSNYQHDAQMLGRIMVITQEKAQKRDSLEMSIRGMAMRVQNKFGTDHEHYRRLALQGIAGEEDSKLVRTARRVGRVLDAIQAELATEGLTPALLAQYHALVTAFDQAIDQQADAQIDRDIATLERTKLMNNLYRAIVKVANYGKDFYYSRNEAKYSHYLLTDQPEVPRSQRTGTLAVGEVRALQFKALGASSTLRVKVLAGELALWCAPAQANTTPDSAMRIAAPADIQLKANQLGYTKKDKLLMAAATGTEEATYEVYRL